MRSHVRPKILDILIGADAENSKAVYAALSKFGAPIEGLSAKDFAEPDSFFRMGTPPARDPQDRSAERNQDTEPKDLPRSRDKGLDDDLN